MRKAVVISLAVAGGVVAVAAGTLLIGPHLIDWTRYKPLLAKAVHDATGRKASFGDISLSVLPRPELVLRDVRLSNLRGGSAPHMVAVDEVAVAVPLLPLLGGEVRVESLRLVKPVVALDVLPGGRVNWDLKPAGADAAEGESEAEPAPAPGTGLAVSLQAVEIIDGSVTYTQRRGKSVTRVEGLDAVLAADSLQGPFRGEGGATVQGQPLRFTLGTGALDPAVQAGDKPLSLTATVHLKNGGTGIKFSGEARLGATPGLRGELGVDGLSLAGAAEGLAGVSLSPALGKPFSLAATVNATGQRVALEPLAFGVGAVKASGHVAATLNDKGPPDLDIDLGFGRLDLDNLLKAAMLRPEGDLRRRAALDGLIGRAHAAGEAPAAPAPAATPAATGKGEEALSFTLPKPLNARVSVSADAVVWNGGTLDQPALVAALSDGVLTLERLSTRTPGDGALAVSGKITTPGGKPAADLALDIKAENLRGLLSWLAVDTAGLPRGALTSLALNGRVSGSSGQLDMKDAALTVDGQSLRAGASLRTKGKRTAMGLSVTAATLNLTPYLKDGGTAGTAAAGSGKGGAPLFADLGMLNDVDGSLKVEVGTLVLPQTTIKQVNVDAALSDGTLTLRQAAVGDLMGGAVALSGGVGGFGGTPSLRNLRVHVSLPQPAATARALDVALPDTIAALGAMKVDAVLNGVPDALDIKGKATLGNLELAADGVVRGLLGSAPGFEGKGQMHHPDTAALLKVAAPGVKMAGPLGAMLLKGDVKASAASVALSNLSAGVGNQRLTGALSLDTAGTRPKVVGTLEASRLDLDAFLPPPAQRPRKAGATPAPSKGAAGGKGKPAPAKPAGKAGDDDNTARWSSDPIDLSGLKALDATLDLKVGRLNVRDYDIEDAALVATLAAGKLSLNQVKGKLFGGAMEASGVVDASGTVPAVSMGLKASGVQLQRAAKALDTGAPVSGKASVTLTLETSGSSELAMVRALGGKGKIDIDNLDVAKGKAAGSSVMLTGPVQALNGLAALGGAKSGTAATVDATLTIDRGVVDIKPMTIRSALYSGDFGGQIKLVPWTINGAGTAKLGAGLLSGVLKLPDTVPVTVKGSLDSPDINVDTGKAAGGLLGGSAAKALQDPGAAAAGLVGGLLGGAAAKATADQKKAAAPAKKATTPAKKTQPPAKKAADKKK